MVSRRKLKKICDSLLPNFSSGHSSKIFLLLLYFKLNQTILMLRFTTENQDF